MKSPESVRPRDGAFVGSRDQTALRTASEWTNQSEPVLGRGPSSPADRQRRLDQTGALPEPISGTDQTRRRVQLIRCPGWAMGGPPRRISTRPAAVSSR
jgi:hypothetical protein